MNKNIYIPFLILVFFGCSDKASEQNELKNKDVQKHSNFDSEFSIPFEKYQLENGLTIILHQDNSDPIVALSTTVHVGSNREQPGKTGFAHFFEHMAFNDSENVPQGANRKMIEELGGSRNGSTWPDGTNYYEVVPKDAFEKLLWIDSDRLGFMINTVTEDALEREKQVVKNEKRQRIDNRPYGHTYHVINKNLYPLDHPYNWTTIGDLKDLQQATLDDVRKFYDEYYSPSNATFVIAGDIDIEKTKTMVERWFGEIKSGTLAADPAPRHVTLESSKSLFHLDNFAKVPELRITFPTIEMYHPDSYPLATLASLLTEGKRAPLYKEIVESEKLAPSVWAFHNAMEITGVFSIGVRANENIDLDSVKLSIEKALANFEKDLFDDKDLERIKIQQEVEFYSDNDSVLERAISLGRYNEYAGDPSFIAQDIKNIQSVTKADVIRVYEKYIKNKPAIYTSFVPKDQPLLTLENSLKAGVEEEVVVQNNEREFDSAKIASYSKTPTKHDRTEPPLGEAPKLTSPKINSTILKNGLSVLSIEHREMPIVNFQVRIDGGALVEEQNTFGTATLLASLITEGTAEKTSEELEDELALLGASISARATLDAIYIEGSTLAKNYLPTIDLLKEILLKPRWDAQEFERLKLKQVNSITQTKANASAIAYQVYYRTLFGASNRQGHHLNGTVESVSSLDIEHLKAYYKNYFSPKAATLHIVGDVTVEAINKSVSDLAENWKGEQVLLPQLKEVPKVEIQRLYFVDLDNAKQSAIYAGKLTINSQHRDFFELNTAHNRLGSGMGARLGQTLRIEKGYTYGAYAWIDEENYLSPFIVSTQVRTNVTLESLEIIRNLVSNYDETLSENELELIKNLLIKRDSRRFETTNSLLNLLNNISLYGKSETFIQEQQSKLESISLERARSLYQTYLNEEDMIYVVVGDAKTQLERLSKLGLGEPVLVNSDGVRL